jgi:hypothetical protein
MPTASEKREVTGSTPVPTTRYAQTPDEFYGPSCPLGLDPATEPAPCACLWNLY